MNVRKGGKWWYNGKYASHIRACLHCALFSANPNKSKSGTKRVGLPTYSGANTIKDEVPRLGRCSLGMAANGRFA